MGFARSSGGSSVYDAVVCDSNAGPACRLYPSLPFRNRDSGRTGISQPGMAAVCGCVITGGGWEALCKTDPWKSRADYDAVPIPGLFLYRPAQRGISGRLHRYGLALFCTLTAWPFSESGKGIHSTNGSAGRTADDIGTFLTDSRGSPAREQYAGGGDTDRIRHTGKTAIMW